MGALAGSAYVDGGNDAVKGLSDPGIPGATVILEGTDQFGQAVRRTVMTGADGGYRFDQLQPGTYALTELQPAGYLDALDAAGAAGGTVGNDKITAITLRSGAQATGYNFGEHLAPAFTTSPVLEIKAGAAYFYDADASDLEKDPIAYSLIQGPAGLAVSSTTGVVTWSPVTADVGNHKLVIRASDGRGGTADQPYTLTVLSGWPNRPPRFTSTPIVDAQVGIPYVYQAAAMDPDGDTPLTYDLIAGPAGLAVSTAGLVSWSPTDAQLGTQTVSLRVSDNRAALPNAGGTDTQTYTILVRQSPGNHPPVIISQPSTTYRPPVQIPSLTVFATVRDFRMDHPDFEKGISGPVTGLLQNTLGLDGKPVFVAAPGAGAISSAASFNQWYHDVRNVNRTTIIPMTLAETPAGSGSYQFSSLLYFFPIDNQLWGNEGLAHNQHFTLELHTSFTPSPCRPPPAGAVSISRRIRSTSSTPRPT